MAVLQLGSVPPLTDPTLTRRWLTAERVVCAVVLLSFGLRIYLPSQVPLALILVAATSPAWLGVLKRYRHGVALAVLTVTAVLFGLGLSILAFSTHYVARVEFVGSLSLTLLIFAGVGVILWGRELFGTRITALLFASGMLIGSATNGFSITLNAWKGAWGIPVTILVLALTHRRRWLTVVALGTLLVVCVIYETRAQAAVLFIALMLVVWQMRPTAASRRVSSLWTGIMLAGLGGVIYYLGSEALARGLLGSEAQVRSLRQIDEAGSLILGGRPEIAATLSLMAHKFWGYGFGAMPRTSDVLVGKEGLVKINYNPNNGYVDRYMFGNGFELHSVVGDVWIRMGPAGLLLMAAVALILTRGLADQLVSRTASGLVLFAVLWSFWNLCFSPLLSAALPLALAIGLALPRLQDVSADPRPPAT